MANAIAENIRPPLLPELEITTFQGKNPIVVKIARWKDHFISKNRVYLMV